LKNNFNLAGQEHANSLLGQSGKIPLEWQCLKLIFFGTKWEIPDFFGNKVKTYSFPCLIYSQSEFWYMDWYNISNKRGSYSDQNTCAVTIQ
jgi:hypothetical protein